MSEQNKSTPDSHPKDAAHDSTKKKADIHSENIPHAQGESFFAAMLKYVQSLFSGDGNVKPTEEIAREGENSVDVAKEKIEGQEHEAKAEAKTDEIKEHATDQQLPTEEGEKKLTVEEIEKMNKAEAGEAQDSGFSVPDTVLYGHQGHVDSIPRNLGIGPFPQEPNKLYLPTLPENEQPVDHGVNILDLTPKLNGGDAVVNEADLLASRGPNESAGSDIIKGPTTVEGDFKISAPDGVGSLSVGGENIIVNNVFIETTIKTPLGSTLHFTAYDPSTGVVTYEYTLNDNQTHPSGDGKNNLFEDFKVVLIDTDGDSASDVLSIRIIDDVPTIKASEASDQLVVDESFLSQDATGSFANLFTSVAGADGAKITYSLGVSAEGANSGLVDTLSNQSILL